ncbi:hypothetical protein EBZ80_13395 [bacterium]|nr:hypothetical protein [bacterium]
MESLAPETQNIWTTAESWDNLTWLWDWDHMISPGRVLQKYLYEHHTIPFWNLYLCGGQFELQNPQSFTFTWPSILQYLMRPAAAIMCLWLLMTIAGTWATARLLLFAGTRNWIAWTCAVAFTFSGYFGAHFNQGHATFSFFHLIPLLCLALVHEWRHQYVSGRSRMVGPWLVLCVFLLFSAPSIQALVYAFPAFLVLMTALFIPSSDKVSRLRDHAGFVTGVVTSCVLGVFMAGYKFMPVVFQALSRRRDDIFIESYGPSLLFRTMFTFVSRPATMWSHYKFEGRVFAWWEYAAFISPLVVLLALVAFFFAWQAKDFYSSLRRRILLAGVVLLVMGCVLTLGNGFWLEMTHDGQSAGPLGKLLQSVRVFPRFQFLSLFGATLCAGISLECLAHRMPAIGEILKIPLARSIIMILLAGPSLVQSALMVYEIEAVPDRFLQENLGISQQFNDAARSGVPLLSHRVLKMPGILSAQDLAIRRGAIVDECYDQFFPVRPQYQLRSRELLRPMTNPPVAALANITGHSFDLRIPASLDRNLILNMSLVDQVGINPGPVIGPLGMEFEREKVAGRDIHFEFPLDDVLFGFYVSFIALVTTGLLHFRARIRRREYPLEASQ